MGESLAFFAPGLPAPGGSKRAFAHKATGRVIVQDDCRRNKDWRAVVALAAQGAMAGRPLLEGPLAVAFVFHLPRPKGHFGGGRNAGKVRRSAPAHPAVKPDALKLARSTEDALTGIVWRDDAQTVQLRVEKRYGGSPGAEIEIRRLVAGESEGAA